MVGRQSIRVNALVGEPRGNPTSETARVIGSRGEGRTCPQDDGLLRSMGRPLEGCEIPSNRQNRQHDG